MERETYNVDDARDGRIGCAQEVEVEPDHVGVDKQHQRAQEPEEKEGGGCQCTIRMQETHKDDHSALVQHTD